MNGRQSGSANGESAISQPSALPREALPLLGTIAVGELAMLAAIPVASGGVELSGLAQPPIWSWLAPLLVALGLAAIWSRRRSRPVAPRPVDHKPPAVSNREPEPRRPTLHRPVRRAERVWGGSAIRLARSGPRPTAVMHARELHRTQHPHR
jgi:hypothetical protein